MRLFRARAASISAIAHLEMSFFNGGAGGDAFSSGLPIFHFLPLARSAAFASAGFASSSLFTSDAEVVAGGCGPLVEPPPHPAEIHKRIAPRNETPLSRGLDFQSFRGNAVS